MLSQIRHIYTKEAPEPGAYSQAVKVDFYTETIYVAGQTANDPSLPEQAVVSGGVGPQTTQALKNVAAILKAVDAEPKHLVSVDVFLKDTGDPESRHESWRQYNDAYVEFFKQYNMTSGQRNMPARMQVWVADVPWAIEDTVVEIRAIAARLRA